MAGQLAIVTTGQLLVALSATPTARNKRPAVWLPHNHLRPVPLTDQRHARQLEAAEDALPAKHLDDWQPKVPRRLRRFDQVLNVAKDVQTLASTAERHRRAVGVLQKANP